MTGGTEATGHLPELLTAHEVAAAMRQDLHTTHRKLRTGQIRASSCGGTLAGQRSDLDALLGGAITGTEKAEGYEAGA